VAPVADGVSPGVLVIAGTPIGDPRKAALAAVVAAYGLDRKAVYDAVVAAKKAQAARPDATQESGPPPRP
jgi:hypothetical protein